jgi:hypothetical protein
VGKQAVVKADALSESFDTTIRGRTKHSAAGGTCQPIDPCYRAQQRVDELTRVRAAGNPPTPDTAVTSPRIATTRLC